MEPCDLRRRNPAAPDGARAASSSERRQDKTNLRAVPMGDHHFPTLFDHIDNMVHQFLPSCILIRYGLCFSSLINELPANCYYSNAFLCHIDCLPV